MEITLINQNLKNYQEIYDRVQVARLRHEMNEMNKPVNIPSSGEVPEANEE